MELVKPELGLVFWMLLAFLLLLFLLRKFAWVPILNMLHQREESIDEALNAANKAREEMQQLQFSNEQLLHQAKEERDAILREARKIKDGIIEESKLKAKEEAQRIVDAAKESIQYEKLSAITELKNQIALLSIEIAEKVLVHELSEPEKQKALIHQLMKDIKLN